MFLYHYGSGQKVGGRNPRNNGLLINILRRGPITYYFISFDKHKNFYDFFSVNVVDEFLNSVYAAYRPEKDNRSKDTMKLLTRNVENLLF